MILETLPAVSALTVDQKLRLVSELWHDVSREGTITADTAALLDERLQEHAANPAAVRSTEQVTAGILALKKHIAASRA
ncbi:addiction module protein [Prosthecobacter vanneervenii]|uniref:Putative addiction module component (TIGR02574 family) n=1 Tax=Prosthecobacter vanneervenii TaxID=48466 RepID=A0A7W7YD16_9BACT|nr:addiction module protein [Prosthecobacter vanneervenii]MBB5033849.1 putative addiction module component (TIGR02574 family) [Prosthecobacter vanneervenii]